MLTSKRPLLLSIVAAGIALAAASTTRAAADPPSLDPLDLAADAPPVPSDSTTSARLFAEAAAGRASRRYGLDGQGIGRISLDGRMAGEIPGGLRGVLSARVDLLEPESDALGRSVLSLREAYASWQDAGASMVLDLGRINLREGPGYGYNPTDYFRDGSLRTVTTQDPLALRESRLGSVMLRGQYLWPDASLTVALSPKLDSNRSTEGWSPDFGATNNRHRGVMALGNKWSEAFSTRVLAYREQGAVWGVGGSASALVADAWVAHGEWSLGREPSLLARARGEAAPVERRQRAALGLTYTTTTNLTVTAEVDYNGFALDRDGWQSLAAAGPAAYAGYFLAAQARNELASRHAAVVYAVQRDLWIRKLDLTALVRYNRGDRSRMVWADLRYRMEGLDLALQVQHNGGTEGSEFGSIPIRHAVGVVAAFYFF